MSDEEEVGSVAEEAAKLFEALQGWAAGGSGTNGAPSDGATGGTAGAASGLGGGLGARLSDIHEHIATGDRECTYCPLCQAIGFIRQTTPEVRTHLTVAASSLLQAAAGLLESRAPHERPSGVQKIDLDDDPPPAPPRAPGWDAE